MAVAYRLLHASDLHLSHIPYSLGPGIPNPHWPGQSNHRFMKGHDDAVLEAFARFVYRYGFTGTTNDPRTVHGKAPLFDRIFLTGDMATTGFRADLDRALRFVADRPGGTAAWWSAHQGMMEPTIGFLRDLIELMPGNHDRYEASISCMPGATEFDTVFNDPNQPRQFWHVGQGVQCWGPVMKKQGGRPLALIAGDFTLHPKDFGQVQFAGWYGQGRAYAATVQAMETMTLQVSKACRAQKALDPQWEHPAILWAIHFDVTTASHTLQLLNAANLVQALKRNKIPALLCGHTHESLVMPIAITTTALVAGSVSQADAWNHFDTQEPANDFQILRIEVPDLAGDPLNIEIAWYRYVDFPQTIAQATAKPAGRFVPIVSKLVMP